jgi:hypothetical protein
VKTLHISATTATLTEDGTQLWSSDTEHDDSFAEEFGEHVTGDDFDALIDWLGDKSLIGEGEEVEGDIEDYDGPDDDDDDDDYDGPDDDDDDDDYGALPMYDEQT